MTNWDTCIERARELAHRYPASAEILEFYIHLVELQRAGAPREKFAVLVREADPEAAREFLAQFFPDRQGGESRQTGALFCPRCSGPPLLGILRVEGEGGKKSLFCPACSAEYPVNRIVCPACGEADHAKLPIYSSPDFPHIRVDACDTCHTYLKTIDLTRDGLAIPEVDEIASVALDLWAREHNYQKLRANLAGL